MTEEVLEKTAEAEAEFKVKRLTIVLDTPEGQEIFEGAKSKFSERIGFPVSAAQFANKIYELGLAAAISEMGGRR